MQVVLKYWKTGNKSPKKSRVAFAVRTEKPSSELCQLPKWGNNRLGRDRGERQEFCVAIPSLR